MYSCCVSESLSACCCVSGTAGDDCGCPMGFRRYGSRCLLLLEPAKDYWNADGYCMEKYNSTLAVPHSPEEQRQIEAAALDVLTGSNLTKVWLGPFKGEHSDSWSGFEGCGPIDESEFYWASGQPDDPTRFVAYAPPGTAESDGWYTHGLNAGPFRPLCQLHYCYRPDCIDRE